MGACKWTDHTTQLNCLLLRGQPKTASEAESGEDGYLTRTHTRLREKKGIDSQKLALTEGPTEGVRLLLNAHCWPIHLLTFVMRAPPSLLKVLLWARSTAAVIIN